MKLIFTLIFLLFLHGFQQTLLKQDILNREHQDHINFFSKHQTMIINATEHEKAMIFQAKQYQNKKVTVHLVPHSHDDLGWIQTFDEYYKNDVSTIYDSVINELSQDIERKFSIVEIGFFQKWYDSQDSEQQYQIKQLVSNNQIEFINGGWCSNDEATTYYEDIIEQMSLGHQWLKKTFDVKPTSAWQIDPFGHSNGMAKISSQLGFDSFFMARIDAKDKAARLEKKAMEMIWKPTSKDQIFTSVFFNHYEAPQGFCIDQKCDQSIKTEINGGNINHKAKEFVNIMRNVGMHFEHNTNIIQLFGSDFWFKNARDNFQQIDLLIDHINSNNATFNMEVKYSTPRDYIKAINSDKYANYPEKTDDFFPYSDKKTSYWTGYFSSRSNSKYYMRESGRYLQKIKTMWGLMNWDQIEISQESRLQFNSALQGLKESVSMMQHHDAMTGTEKKYVADDYHKMLAESTTTMNQALYEVLWEVDGRYLDYSQCKTNTTAANCEMTFNSIQDKKSVFVSVYNPSAKKTEVIRIKVPYDTLEVIDSKQEEVDFDLICHEEKDYIENHPVDRENCDIYFIAFLEENSFHTFEIRQSKHKREQVKEKVMIFGEDRAEIKLDRHRKLKISDDLSSFELHDHDSKRASHVFPFNLDYKYYDSYFYDRKKGAPTYTTEEELNEKLQNSGAYIFKTDGGKKELREGLSAKIYQGKILTLIKIKSDKIDTYLRFYDVQNHYMNQGIEIETFLHKHVQNQEITLNVATKIDNQNDDLHKIFYTDSNGLEMMKRETNHQETFQYEAKKNTEFSSNYYPVSKMISIKDSELNIVLLNDRSQGGSSLNKGEIELMIHRSLTNDDARGVAEALQENKPIRMKHYLLFLDNKSEKNQERKVQYHLDLQPIVLLSSIKNSDSSINQNKEIQLDKRQDLPQNDLLKLQVEYREENQDFQIRLHNMKDDGAQEYRINQSFNEMTLSANQEKKEWLQNKLVWNAAKGGAYDSEQQNSISDGQKQFYIDAQEIRTFLVKKKLSKEKKQQIEQEKKQENKEAIKQQKNMRFYRKNQVKKYKKIWNLFNFHHIYNKTRKSALNNKRINKKRVLRLQKNHSKDDRDIIHTVKTHRKY